MNSEKNHLKINQKIFMEFIQNQLYPTEKFPRNLFPDLHNILLNFFITFIKSKSNLWDTFQQTKNKKIIEEMADEVLNFKNILKNHPHTIILIYHQLITKYIRAKHHNPAEREDFLQEIITRLLSDKIPKIQKQYDFNLKNNPSFTSYFMVIVRNIYVDLIRESRIRMLKTVDTPEIQKYEINSNAELVQNHLFIEEEFMKFLYILKMYYKLRPKIELCLKIKYRFQINEDDINKCYPNCSSQTKFTLMQDFRLKKDKQVFKTIIPVFNSCENKKNKSDTLRKWVTVKIDEIISHLNHTHDHKVYNNDSISDLIGLYYQKKTSNKRERNGK